MNILAIETSTETASIALRSDSHTALTTFDARGLLTESLAPQVYKLLADNDVQAQDIDAIVVGKGPGSYTGLRVGMVFAAVTAWTLGKHYYEVPTLLATAISVLKEGHSALSHSAVSSWPNGSWPKGKSEVAVGTANAYRHEIYARVVKQKPDGIIDEGQDEIMEAADFSKLVQTQAADTAVTVLGFGCETLQASGAPPERVRLMKEAPLSGAEALLMTLDVLGMDRFRSDAHRVSPTYLRKSSAELQRGNSTRG